MNIQLHLHETQVQRLIRYAYSNGWARENPRKAWTEREKKEVVRWAISHMVPSDE